MGAAPAKSRAREKREKAVIITASLGYRNTSVS